MINKKKKYVGRLTLAAAITSILFSGCGAAQKELAQTDRASYEKISYQTVTVQSGSLTPQTTISLRAQGYTRFSYGATNTELTLEKVNVAVGDHVKKGDILVCHYIDPEWTPLFAIAGGVIADTGGVLSHAAIVVSFDTCFQRLCCLGAA